MRTPRRRRGLPPFAAGLLGVALIAAGAYFAFTQANPFSSPYELTAVFESAQNLKPGSPVRTAGVDVGEVASVEPIADGSGRARVHMELTDQALPIHSDADARVIPRLFLEGNFVIDLRPGSPSAPKLDSGSELPVERTASSVSFEQVLKVLDRDTRRSLQTLLDEYSTALVTGGAEGFNRSIRHWVPAYRNTAIASEALLGTEPGDLRRVLRGQQRTLAALVSDREDLEQLVVGLSRTTAAFAREDDALAASIPALRDTLRSAMPALASLDDALPSLRAFAREALPGVRSSAPALEQSEPFVRQLRLALGPAELGGLAGELRGAVPALASLNARAIRVLRETRLLSSCTNEVLVPWAFTPIPDPDFPEADGQPTYKEGPRALVGLAGESRTGDANTPWFRLQAGGGPTTVVIPGGETAHTLFAQTNFPQQGARPAKPARRPPFRPDVPCETQSPPNLEAPLGNPDPTVTPQPRSTPATRRLDRRVARELPKLVEFMRLQARGRRAEDPISLGPPRVAKEAAR